MRGESYFCRTRTEKFPPSSSEETTPGPFYAPASQDGVDE